MLLNNYKKKEDNLRHSPFCRLHSQKNDQNCQMNFSNGTSLSGGSSPIVGWLPNVIVSLRTFKSAVHKLLNDHGGQMPLSSFMDCYKCCIFNENSLTNNHRGIIEIYCWLLIYHCFWSHLSKITKISFYFRLEIKN